MTLQHISSKRPAALQKRDEWPLHAAVLAIAAFVVLAQVVP
jgi:negative regulator of sigma E activity